MRSIAPLSGVVDQLGNEARFFSAHAPVAGFVAGWPSICAWPAKDVPHWRPRGVASRAEAQRCYGAAASGVDCSVIALWLGHESIETTQTYLHAHLALKEAALAKLEPYERGKRTRVRPILLAFLEAL
jgi:hypothetical protein